MNNKINETEENDSGLTIKSTKVKPPFKACECRNPSGNKSTKMINGEPSRYFCCDDCGDVVYFKG